MENETLINPSVFICIGYVDANAQHHCSHCELKKSILLFGYHHDPWYYHNQNTVFISENEWNITRAKVTFLPQQMTHSLCMSLQCLCMCVYGFKINDAVTEMNACTTFNHHLLSMYLLSVSQQYISSLWLLIVCHTKLSCLLAWLFDRRLWTMLTQTWGNWNMSRKRMNQWIHPSKLKWHKLFACSFIHFMQIERIYRKNSWRWLLSC